MSSIYLQHMRYTSFKLLTKITKQLYFFFFFYKTYKYIPLHMYERIYVGIVDGVASLFVLS